MRVINTHKGRFYNSVLLKIFEAGKTKPKVQQYRPKPGLVLSEKNVDAILAHVVDQIENHWYPGHDYRFVPLVGGQFNFIHEDECKKCADERRVALCRGTDELLAEANA